MPRLQRSVLLALALALLTPLALAKELRFKSRAYDVTSDLSREELDPLIDRMDLVAAEYARRFSSFRTRDARSPALRIYRTAGAYMDHLAELGINGANSAGMFYVGTGAFPTLAAWTEGNPRGRLYHVLQHEGFHQFLYARLGDNVPIWANEGLAEYFGYAIEVGGKLRTGIAPPSVIHSIQTAVEEGAAFGFGEFIRMTHEQWGARVESGDFRAGIMYDQAWSVAHFLIHADNGKYADRFHRFLIETSEGKSVDQALEAAFGSADVTPFEKAWKQYVADLEPDPVATAVERLAFLAEGLIFLHGQDVRPDSLDALKAELRKIEFRWIVPTHASIRIFESTDDTLFTPPPAARNKAAGITLTHAAPAKPARKPKSKRAADNDDPAAALPPDIVITGQPLDIRLTWFADSGGAPAYEVVFDR